MSIFAPRVLAVLIAALHAIHSGIPPAVASATEACPAPGLRVGAKDAALSAGLCAMAATIRDELEDCGLAQHRPLSIEVEDRPAHPMGGLLAYFDSRYDLIGLTDPAIYATLFAPDHPYARLPAHVTVRALLTHEMAHALAAQSAGARQLNVVDQEYIAAAMQLEQMAPAWRKVFEAATRADFPPEEKLIRIGIYGFAPRKFELNAWRHFRMPGHGCALIRRLVAGEASFSHGPGRGLR